MLRLAVARSSCDDSAMLCTSGFFVNYRPGRLVTHCGSDVTDYDIIQITQ